MPPVSGSLEPVFEPLCPNGKPEVWIGGPRVGSEIVTPRLAPTLAPAPAPVPVNTAGAPVPANNAGPVGFGVNQAAAA